MSLTIVTSFPDIPIPPVLLTVPTTEREVLTAARALERFIIANRAHEGLEEALGKVLPQFDEAPGRRRTFCGVSDVAPSDREKLGSVRWVRSVRVCATPHDINQPQSATSNPMTSPASSAPLYTCVRTPRSGKQRRAEPRRLKKKKVTDDPDKVYTRDDPGNCFVPPQAEACDWCKTHGRVEECLFPPTSRQPAWSANAPSVLCRRPTAPRPWQTSIRQGPYPQQATHRLEAGGGEQKFEERCGDMTSTAVRKDQASKSTARRDPFVLIPHHTLNLHAYKALSDMGPTQQVYGEAISADVGAQQISRVDDTMTRDMAELRYGGGDSPVIPPETLAAAEEALKAAIDGIKVPPAGRYSYKSLIEQSLNLIQGQLDQAQPSREPWPI
ncbi:hypothetical protein FA13DRAFT_1805847 [Coprinellus micaceus]|uniref:Uncharacterized protein n=1 Tax=Coprinellus micaceus TaxID=71717 RepID=A0A4Y7RXS2_COPMI|nr:hypothetical protein FA13DRAFT_1805847 [Coprinellus micaceus]